MHYNEHKPTNEFLHWHDQVNSIAVKLNRADALLLKIRNYVNTKTWSNIYFAIFDPHLSSSCIVWAQNVNTVRILIILQKEALRINLHKYETCWSATNHLNIPTFQTQKYGHFSLKASASNFLTQKLNSNYYKILPN